MCGCSQRMRWLLERGHWEFNAATKEWEKEGYDSIPDHRIEEDHFRILIETVVQETGHSRAAGWLNKLGGIL